jgi:RNA polymerase sigma-70 factor (ECF subfamily)
VPAQPAGFEELELEDALRRAVPRLRRYAARRLHDDHEAEEVVQEAMLRAFQHQSLFATEDDLMAWLTVVTGRLVIDRVRVRGRSVSVAELPPSSRATRDTADVVVARDEARIALDALEAMPSRQAAVLWAREIDGLSYDEICARFEMSEPTVRSVLHRARKTLRREYAMRGGTLPAVGLVALAPWLRGLRLAGRLGKVAKRGTTAAAVAATGMVATAILPIGGGTIHPLAVPAPALRINAQQLVLHPHARLHRHHATAAQHAITSASVKTPASTTVPLPVNPTCGQRLPGQHGVTADCATHHEPTLYVKLPRNVDGTSEVGVSSNLLPCSAVPTTPVAECDGSQQRKGNHS